jgi:hypothetical protein
LSTVTALAPAGAVAAPAGLLGIGPPSGVDAVVEAQAVASSPAAAARAIRLNIGFLLIAVTGFDSAGT